MWQLKPLHGWTHCTPRVVGLDSWSSTQDRQEAPHHDEGGGHVYSSVCGPAAESRARRPEEPIRRRLPGFCCTSTRLVGPTRIWPPLPVPRLDGPAPATRQVGVRARSHRSLSAARRTAARARPRGPPRATATAQGNRRRQARPHGRLRLAARRGARARPRCMRGGPVPTCPPLSLSTPLG
jgi:hypothetical protein